MWIQNKLFDNRGFFGRPGLGVSFLVTFLSVDKLSSFDTAGEIVKRPTALLKPKIKFTMILMLN